VSRQLVAKRGSNPVIPAVDTLIELSKVFDVTVDYLLKPSAIDEKKTIRATAKATCIQLFKNTLYFLNIYLIFLGDLFRQTFLF